MNSPADAERSNVDRLKAQLVFAAAIAGASGVLIGAFGAHGLDSFLADRFPEPELIAKRLDQFDVGVRYHLIHAVALLALATVAPMARRLTQCSAWLMGAGLVLFSGSLYLLVLTNTPWLGAITPLGGLAWIIAWLVLAAVPWSRARGTVE